MSPFPVIAASGAARCWKSAVIAPCGVQIMAQTVSRLVRMESYLMNGYSVVPIHRPKNGKQVKAVLRSFTCFLT